MSRFTKDNFIDVDTDPEVESLKKFPHRDTQESEGDNVVKNFEPHNQSIVDFTQEQPL